MSGKVHKKLRKMARDLVEVNTNYTFTQAKKLVKKKYYEIRKSGDKGKFE